MYTYVYELFRRHKTREQQKRYTRSVAPTPLLNMCPSADLNEIKDKLRHRNRF